MNWFFVPSWRICLVVSAIISVSPLANSAKRSGGGRKPPKTCEKVVSEDSAKLPKIQPIVLKKLDRLTDNPLFLYEMKYDGFRAVAYLEKGSCRFVSRNENDLSQFNDLCESVANELKVENAIFDGEVIAVDLTGRPVFNNLLRRKGPFRYVAFDLLWLNGTDLRSLPLSERRRRLLRILPGRSAAITESLAQVGSGERLYELMVEHDLEGIVVKRLQDSYSRYTRWFKYKNPYYSQAMGRDRFFRKK